MYIAMNELQLIPLSYFRQVNVSLSTPYGLRSKYSFTAVFKKH